MKKTIIMALLLLATVVTYAVPNGCYSGTMLARLDPRKNPCAIEISGNNFQVKNRAGEVASIWTIIKDDGEKLTLKSEYGVVRYAYYGEDEDGIYLSWFSVIYRYAD